MTFFIIKWVSLMIQNEKIDIIMATYNGEKFLEEQIDSIINQTCENWNLLIRDDNSTDNTLKILEKYEKKDKRIKIIKDNKKKLGIVKNFEELLKNTTEELIMFSDQDDVWNSHKIEKYSKEVKKNKGKEFLIHSNAILYEKAKETSNRKLFINKKFSKQKIENVFFNYYVQGATILITKGIKNFLLPFFEEVYLHDRYIHIIAEFFFQRIFINEPLIYYRQHGNNQIGAKSNIKKLLKKRYFDERDKILIEKIYWEHNQEILKEKKEIIEKYFEITNNSKNRLEKYFKLKVYRLDMPVKKQIALLIKG